MVVRVQFADRSRSLDYTCVVLRVPAQIQVKNNNATRAAVQELLNSSTTTILLNLTVGGSFTARVQAYTRSGYGPYSAPVPIVMDPAYPARAHSSATNSESLIIILLAALVVMLACVIVTVVYLKRKQNAGKQLRHFSGKYTSVVVNTASTLKNVENCIRV